MYLVILPNYTILYLVGGIPTPLKNMSSSVGMMTFPTQWKNKKCSKPPTSNNHGFTNYTNNENGWYTCSVPRYVCIHMYCSLGIRDLANDTADNT